MYQGTEHLFTTKIMDYVTVVSWQAVRDINTKIWKTLDMKFMFNIRCGWGRKQLKA